MKVGFKLDEFFDIRLDSKRNTVTVSLPAPTILTHEVYPKVDKLDIGWLREVQNTDFNKNFNLLRREFRRDALDSDIMDKAKVRADELMNTMLGPVVTSLNKRYKLKVRFKESPIADMEAPILGAPVKVPAEAAGSLILTEEKE